MTTHAKVILGIGNDIIEIARVRTSVHRYQERFLKRLFTQKEQAYCHRYKDPVPHLAARFAAKEALAKALGHGFGKELSWLDLEILNNEKGRPEVFCSPSLTQSLHAPLFMLSMSHSKDYATATALWCSGS
jgi:holo-[acyl-carrier protein] synthase